ncbi:MAG TPA: nucleotidyltransferase family protein [Thermoanaerobaculia bacterium]|nr:nucleotidyltransferase family protein [Thermoanaerobaculia bacterium]
MPVEPGSPAGQDGSPGPGATAGWTAPARAGGTDGMAGGADGAVAGILLAAGTSSRMGCNKLLFELGGESVLRGAVRRAMAAGLSPLLVVLGHQAERTRQELDGLACQVVINPEYDQGITSSLKAGVSALPPGVPAAMVLLADMPLVSVEMIAGLVARYRATRAPLVISDYAGVNAPPMLYDRRLFDELRAMTGGGCGRQVVKRHRTEAEMLSWPAATLADLDVPEDYARIRDAPKP